MYIKIKSDEIAWQGIWPIRVWVWTSSSFNLLTWRINATELKQSFPVLLFYGGMQDRFSNLLVCGWNPEVLTTEMNATSK